MEIASKRRNETLAPISHLSCLAIAQDLAGCRYFSRGCWRLELPNSAPRAVNWDQIKFVEELHISIFFDNLVKAINCCLSLILVVQCRLCSRERALLQHIKLCKHNEWSVRFLRSSLVPTSNMMLELWRYNRDNQSDRQFAQAHILMKCLKANTSSGRTILKENCKKKGEKN